MNAPFVVAQATGSAASAAPVQTIKLYKPAAGETVVFKASFTGQVKIIFSDIANEKITLFKDNAKQSLHIIFADGSQAIIEPFYDSTGSVLSNLIIEVSPGQDFTGAQFALQFPVTTDQSVLPAAGPGAAGQTSGANFSDPSVDPLGPSNPLALLGQEELPNIQFTATQPANIDGDLPGDDAPGTPFVLAGTLFGVVEEEHNGGGDDQREVGLAFIFGAGNEDPNDTTDSNFPDDPSGLDQDTSSDQNITTNVFGPGSTGYQSLATLVTSSAGAPSFAIEVTTGTPVTDAAGNPVTSGGDPVKYLFINPTFVIGFADGNNDGLFSGTEDRQVFVLFIEQSTGDYQFVLNDKIDHGTPTTDDATNPVGAFEETLALDFSELLIISDGNGDHTLPDGTFTVGVIDDTPVTNENVNIAFDDESAFIPYDFPNPGGTGDIDPDPDNPAAAQTLNFSFGADGEGTVLLLDTGAPAGFTYTVSPDGLTLTISQEQTDFFGVTADVDVIAIILTDPTSGEYTAAQLNPVFHPTAGESEENVSFTINYQVTDGDLDAIDGSFSISVDDDTPEVCIGSVFGEVDEDALTSPAASEGNEDDTRPGETDGTYSTTVGACGCAGSLFPLAHFGADGPNAEAFGLVDAAAADAFITALGLKSQGDDVNDVSITGDTLTALASDGREVFKLTVNGDGSWEFELVDQVDHPLTDDPSTEFDTEEAFEDTITINLGGLLQAFDGDGDPVTLTGADFTIAIRDDIPYLDGVNDVTGSIAEATSSDGLTDTFTTSIGADEPGQFDISPIGQDQYFFVQTDNPDGTITLEAFFDDLHTQPVYTLIVDPANGTYNFHLDADALPGTVTTFTDSDVVQIDAGSPQETIVGTLTVAGNPVGTITFDGVNFTNDAPGDFVRTDPEDNTDALHPSNEGFGVGNNNTHDNQGFIATLSGTTAKSLDFTVNFNGNGVDFTDISWQAYKNGVLVGSGQDHVENPPGGPQDAPYTIDPAGDVDFDTVIVRFDFDDAGGAVSAKNINFTAEVGQTVSPTEVDFGFELCATDFDTDEVCAEFTVTVTDTVPTLTLPGVEDPGTEVFEAGLAARGLEPAGSGEIADGNGTDNDDPSEATAGTFTFSSPDDLQTLTIGGTVLTLAELQAATPGTPIDIAGNFGTMSITGFTGDETGGDVTYTYTLADNTSGDSESDDFAIEVKDSDNDVITGVLEVAIVDDEPNALNDTDSVANLLSTTGNVIDGTDTDNDPAGDDVPGADGAIVTAIEGDNPGGDPETAVGAGGVTISGQYGSLTIAQDGSYTYTRDNGDPLTANDVFTYTFEDGDGDDDTATLTISISDSGVNVRGLSVEGGEETVNENDLSDGTSPDTPALTQIGTFTITAANGIDDLTIGGTLVVTDGVVTLPASPIDTDYGKLTITGVNLGTGDVDYSYVLDDNTVDHGPGDNGENTVSDDIAVVVTDVDGDSANATLNVAVIDDIPSVTLTTEAPLEIKLDESIGADAADLATAPEADDTGPSPFGTQTASAAGLFNAVNYGADGAGVGGGFGLVLTNDLGDPSGTYEATSLSVVDAAGAFADDQVYLVKISDTQVNGVVGNAGTDIAFTIKIDAGTGLVTVEQYLAISHTVDGATAAQHDDPAALAVVGQGGLGGVFASLTAVDGDGDVATTNSSAPLSISFEDDGPAASDLTGATFAEGSSSHDIGVAATILGIDAGTDGLQGTLQGITFTNQGVTGGTLAIDGTGHLIYTSPASVTSATTVTETFSYTVTDNDGDTVTRQVTFGVSDTGITEVSATNELVDEDDIALAAGNPAGPGDDAALTTGHISFTLGADALASITLSVVSTGLTKLDGVTPVQTTWDSGTNTLTGYGTSTADVVFTIVLSNITATGADYDVTLLQPVLHPVQDDPSTTPTPVETAFEDNLGFTVDVSVKDADNSEGITSFQVAIDDDTPIASDLTGATFAEGSGTHDIGIAATILGINSGADGLQGTLQGITFTNQGVTGGTLAIDGTGHLIYTSPASVTSDSTVTETFSYTVTDNDGDTVTKQVTFGVSDTGIVEISASNELVDEDDIALAAGNPAGPGDDAPLTTGHISFSLGADALASITLSVVSTGLTKLDGVTPVQTVWDSGTNTLTGYGTSTADIVFTIVLSNITATGADYDVTLLQPVLHPVQDDPSTNPTPVETAFEDNLGFTVDVSVKDADNSEGITSFQVTIDDDTPTANDDIVAGTITASIQISGLLGNDVFGADGVDTDNTPVSGQVTATNGAHGTVVYNDDGTFTYTPDDNYSGADSFTYTITDGDGDQDTATVSLTVDTDNTPTAGEASITVDDEGLTNGILGNGQSSGDFDVVPNPEHTASGTLPFNVFSDGPADIDLQPMDTLTRTVGTETLTFTWNDATNTLTGASVARGDVLQVTIDDPTTGAYTLTLLKPILHAAGDNENDASFDLDYRVRDNDTDAATGTVHVTVDDDTPTISAIQDATLENANGEIFNGTWNPAFGADNIGSIALALGSDPAGVDYQSSSLGTTAGGLTVFKVDAVVGPDTLYTFYYTSAYDGGNEAGILTAYTQAPTGTSPNLVLDSGAKYFILTMDADGTYQFELISNELTTTTAADATSNDVKAGNYNPEMYVVGDQFYDAATLPVGAVPDITIDGFNGATDENVFVNNNGIAVGSGNFDTGERMELDFASAQTVVELTVGKFQAGSSVSFSVSVNGGAAVNMYVTSADPVLTIDAADFGVTDFTSLSITKIADINPGDGIGDDPDIAINSIVYNSRVEVGDADYNFQVSITDGDGDTTTSSDELSVHLSAPANDAPAGTDKTIGLNEDNTYVFTAADFGFSDGDGHLFAGVVIDTLPAGTAGILRLGNTALAAGTFVTAEQIADGSLIYTPLDNVFGNTGDTSFTFSVRDDGPTGGAHVNEDQTPNTMTLNMSDTNFTDLTPPSSSGTIIVQLNGSNRSILDSGGSADQIAMQTATGGTTTFTDLNFFQTDNNLQMTWNSAGGGATITILDHYVAANRIESVLFDDGGSYSGYNLLLSAYNLNEDLSGTNGNDIVAGTAAAEPLLDGGSGNDLLFGNGGDDTLRGGTGRDLLVGGLGDDIYDFDAAESGNTVALADVIADFDTASDLIDLAGIDAATQPGNGGNQNFSAMGGFTESASLVANGVTWTQVGADTHVSIDTNGNTANTEMMIVLTGVNANNLTASNFTG